MARKSKRLAVQEEKPLENKNLYNVAVYLRLSVEEKRDNDDSESLENQRDIILDYLQDKTDMKLFSVYCDNGETGTNFEREAFQRMMYDVYNGKVNCIIVKDLSRFGREYIEAGDYLDRIFPLLGIRFIAINDNVDNHVTPFDISVPIKLIMIEFKKNVDVQKANEMMKSKLKRNEKKLKDIRGTIEQEKRKKLDDYILLTKGELTEDEFVKRREVIDSKIAEYTEQEKALTFENVSKEDMTVTDLFSRYIGVEEINREVVQDLIKAIYVYPDNRIEIVWNYKEKIS